MHDMNAQDNNTLKALGYTAHFERNMSLWENFALGFTYLSPVVGVYSVFAIGMTAAGPPMIWWYLIAALGQMTVCLIFCEVVSQFPISGGLYPWCRRLVGRKWAWMAGWIYGWALFASIAAVSAGAAPFVAPLLGMRATPLSSGLVALALVFITTLINLSSTKLLGRVAMFGFVCEIIGALVVGTFLLVFHRHQPFNIVFHTAGHGAKGHYSTAFLSAAIVGLFTCYGFEACGDVAEETPNPSVAIPRAMKSTIYIGMSASIFVCLALILSVPDIGAVVSGQSSNLIENILSDAFGTLGTKLVVLVVLVSFLSCILSLQAAASRLLHAYARDGMIVASPWLGRVSDKHRIPANALLLSGIIAAGILIAGIFFSNTVGTIVSFAVVGIYAGFQMVVIGALFARRCGWKANGSFQLGYWAWPVNILALLWGIAAIAQMLRPSGDGASWYVSWAMALIFLAVILCGAAYMLVFRPYTSSTAPAGDAWKLMPTDKK